jgi:hypothetical protein
MNFLWYSLIAALTFSLSACQRTNIAGADRDAHGCIGSAGYVWSPLHGACVRVFEAGLPFDPTPRNPEQNLRAYLLVKNSIGKLKEAELFWPGESVPWTLKVIPLGKDAERPVVLEDKTHKVKVYRTQESAYLLEQDGKVLFVFGPKQGNPLDTIGQ